MSFVVEDGTGLPTANAYIDVDFATSYYADRGLTGFPDDVAAQQAAIVNATDYLDAIYGPNFIGAELAPGIQALDWPRTWRGQPEGEGLPVMLKRACAELALRSAAQSGGLMPDPTVDPSGYAIQKSVKKLGDLDKEITYDTSKTPAQIRNYPLVTTLLRSLLRNGYGQGTVIRQ